jgi:hypothetical protein
MKIYDSQESFAGGWNAVADRMDLAPNQVPVATNAELTLFGGITQRKGTQRVHTTSLNSGDQIVGLYYWATQNQVLAITHTSGHLYTATPVSGTYPWTWTDQGLVRAGYPNGYNMVAFRDGTGECVYIASGTHLAKWNGTTLTANVSGAYGQALFLAVQNQRLFGVDQSQSLYWSSLNNGDDMGTPSTPGAGGNAVVRTFGENILYSLLPLQNMLVILHQDGLSTFTGWSQADIQIQSGTQGLSPDAGTPYPLSVVNAENIGFFVSTRGIYAITPSGIQSISQPIDSWLTANLPANTNYALAVIGMHDKEQHSVYWWIPTWNFPNQQGGLIAYNYRLNAWSGPWQNGTIGVGGAPPYGYGPSGLSQMTCATLVTPAPTLASGPVLPYILVGCQDGFVRQIEVPGVYLDDVLANGTGGTNYTTSITSRRMYGSGGTNVMQAANAAGNKMSTKAYRFAYVTCNLQSSNVVGLGATTDLGSFANTPAGLTASANSTSSTVRFQTGLNGQYMDVNITDTSAVGPNEYTRIAVEGYDLGPRFSS